MLWVHCNIAGTVQIVSSKIAPFIKTQWLASGYYIDVLHSSIIMQDL